MSETELVIERVGLEGQGVGYDSQGNIYFVPGALPGDRVRVRFSETEKRYRDATLMQILAASGDRREPVCQHFAECGGCDWLHWDYEVQVRAKAAVLEHVIERTPFRAKTWLPFLPSPLTYGYRNRIQLRHAGDALGFYRRQSHHLVPVESCAIAHPTLNQELKTLRNESGRVYAKVELTLNESGEVGRVFDSPHGAEGFCQVNPAQNKQLCAAVADRIVRAKSRCVAELFCGDGNLTFAYATSVKKVVGADASEPAIRKAQDTARERGLDYLEFMKSPVSYSLSRKIGREGADAYDTLVLDPPRSGIGKTLEFFIHPLLKNIIYISCSPVSFSKDVVNLKKYQFVLEEIQGLDMFPHTRHIELVARFSRP